MDKNESICVRELWCPNSVNKECKGCYVSVANHGELNQPLHTAPVYLHEWWVFERKRVKQKYEKAVSNGDIVCQSVYGGAGITLDNFSKKIKKHTGYDIATNTIESEGDNV